MILATVAVAVAVAAAGVGGAASAQGLGSPFYLKGFGGWTLPQNESFDVDFASTGDSEPSGFDYDAGYMLGLSVGYAISPNVAFELEYAYRGANADLKNLDTRGGVASNAFMANAVYRFDGMGPDAAFTPYLGAGLGAADLAFDPKKGQNLSGDYTFAYQLIAGIEYAFNPAWSLNGEVRYFGVNEQDLESSVADLKTSFNTVDALVGFTFHF
ncbi:MAG: porin family protein [Amaricoccus sp.]